MGKKSTLINGVQVTYCRNKVQVGSKDKNRFITRFITVILILTLISLYYLDIDWFKLASRVPDV